MLPGEGVGGVSAPTGGVWGVKLPPISCNLRYSEIIFVTYLKSYFPRKFWE